MALRVTVLFAALFVSTALAAAPMPAQNDAHPALGKQDRGSPPPPTVRGSAATVPFELYRGNRVIVTATLNGHGTQAILDTGASATTLDRAFAKSIGLPAGRPVDAHGAGGSVDAELVDGVTLELGAMRFENMTVAVMDLSLVAQHLGRPTNIIVGRELFNSTAIAFDWQRSRLTMTPATQYVPAAGLTIVPVERRGPFNFVKLSVAGLPAIEALLDLGNGGNLNLPSDYWSKQPVLAELRYADSQSGGVGGLHATRVVTFPTVDFAGRRFDGVPGILGGDSRGNQPQHGANLGIGLLKQFDLTLDLGRDRLVLKPLANPAEFDRDRAGLRAVPAGSALAISFVSPQGPAAKAGIKAGDRIVAINGEAIGKDFFASAAGRWNLASAGTPVTLTLEGGRAVRVVLADFY